MPSPLVSKIGQATRETWPEVVTAMAATNRTMHELAGIADDVIPLVDEYIAKSPTGKLRRRKVCEETIWVLARLGWLRTGPERDLVQAAKAWYDCGPDSTEEQLATAEEGLEQAIRNLPDFSQTPQEAS